MALTETRSDEHDDLEVVVPVRRGREVVPAGRVLATVGLTLLLATLACADTMHRAATGLPFGARRDAAMAFTGPLRAVSHTFGLHLPRLWLTELTGNTDPPTAEPSATTRPRLSAGGADPDGGQGAGATTTVVATTTTLPAHRTPTAEAPLRLLLAGDSLMGNISEGFGRLVRDDGRVAIASDVQVSTGLARPDVLDWPTHLGGLLDATGAEVVVLAFGANDDKPLLLPSGDIAPLGSDAWRGEYAGRVGRVMDLASAGGTRSVVWIGVPTVRRDGLNAAKDVMNDVALTEAARRPGVVFVDTVAQLGGPEYAETAIAPDGSEYRVRISDGVHLTEAACDVLAPALFDAFAADWHL